jgi:tRNA dimethylallyltransferase
MPLKVPWPCLVGPTGIGKSEIAYAIAQKLGYEILSADAFQIYKGLEVGTAQPPQEWQQKVSHHLVGIRNPRENWSAGEFAREAFSILKDKMRLGTGVILVGGSGFYLRALIEGIQAAPAMNLELRARVVEKVENIGLVAAHEWLKTLDPLAAGKIHPNDQYRISRALEKALSSPSSPILTQTPKVDVVLFGIDCPKKQLDEMLKARCVNIWKTGILTEAEKLRSDRIPFDFQVWKAIGYREALDFLDKKISETEALEKIFHRTRQYAKRQRTWFRHQHKIKWFKREKLNNLNMLIDQLASEMLALRGKN